MDDLNSASIYTTTEFQTKKLISAPGVFTSADNNFENNMAPFKKDLFLLSMVERERRKRRCLRQRMALLIVQRKRFLLRVFVMFCFVMQCFEAVESPRIRTCRRYPRNQGFWELAWETYDDTRFKKTFRVSRRTFQYILQNIRQDIQKNYVAELPISPECRLAICLYRLGRGDYLYTIAELFGQGVATVHCVIEDVCEAIVKNLWMESVQKHFPANEQEFTEAMVEMEALWQFPCCWGAVDGCHIPIQCPPGGAQASKEYHNFKNFFSVVMMAVVDAKDRFIWASVGFPGNSHDSVILQSTRLWHDIVQNNIIPPVTKTMENTDVYPMILGDSAFPFRTWLMKPYSHAVLSPEERNFNYRLSRARMVTERGFGQLKSRWRVLYRKLGCHPRAVKRIALACVALHNICSNAGDALPPNLDLTERRDRDEVRRLLQLRNCSKIKDTSRLAGAIRAALSQKFWKEKVGHGVS